MGILFFLFSLQCFSFRLSPWDSLLIQTLLLALNHYSLERFVFVLGVSEVLDFPCYFMLTQNKPVRSTGLPASPLKEVRTDLWWEIRTAAIVWAECRRPAARKNRKHLLMQQRKGNEFIYSIDAVIYVGNISIQQFNILALRYMHICALCCSFICSMYWLQ